LNKTRIATLSKARNLPQFSICFFQNRSPDDTPPTSADFTFDPEELEAAFTKRTKMLVFNSPHNPTGKVIILNLNFATSFKVGRENYGTKMATVRRDLAVTWA
jgi:hypothetical protein